MNTNSYFILWPNNYCNLLAQNEEKETLKVIYGGEHQSVPPLGKITKGDIIYPIRIQNGKLYLLGKIEIEQIIDAHLFLESNNIFSLPNHLWDTSWESVIKSNLKLGHLVPRSNIQFDIVVPLDIIEKLLFGADKKEKPIPIKEGKISHVNMQGHFRRLSRESSVLIKSFFEQYW